MPAYVGVIIAASVLVAAGIAAYESPEFQLWLKQSSQKVAHAFQAFSDDISARTRRTETSDDDPSTREDADDAAEYRRTQAREEIMARSRTLHDRRKRRKLSDNGNRSSSFDNLVDSEGRLRSDAGVGSSTAIELTETPARSLRQSASGEHPLVNIEDPQTTPVKAIEPWESQYEQEMRNAWNMDLPPVRPVETRSHASESLIDLTPTTEDFPDPDYSIPDLLNSSHVQQEPGYFPVNTALRSRTLSPASSSPAAIHSRAPISPLEADNGFNGSMAGSVTHVEHEDVLTDDGFSEIADGLRTPASAWTEVGSSVSGDDDQNYQYHSQT